MSYQNPNFSKDDYWARRHHVVEIKSKRGKVIDTIPDPVRGQVKPVVAHQVVKDEEDQDQRVPLSHSYGDQHNVQGLRRRNRSKISTSKHTQKGFAGHAVNPPAKSQHFFPPEMTNKERNEWRRERRKKLAEARREAEKAEKQVAQEVVS